MDQADNAAAGSGQPRGAVIFDMDGTIVHLLLDFDDIRRQIGIPPGPVLETIEPWTGQVRRRAEAILLQRELQAAEQCELLPDAKEVLIGLRRGGWRVALLTRNCRAAAELVLKRHGLEFDAVRTREDGVIKPSPEPVQAICRDLGVACENCWVVGDYLFDIQSGRDAGARTVLVRGPRTEAAWSEQADFFVQRLGELPALLESGLREKNS